MNFKNTNPTEHAFLIGLGYEEKQYGYVRSNDNDTTSIVTPFDDFRFQIWGTYSDGDSKLYDTNILQFASYPQFQSVVLLFEQLKEVD